MAKRKKFVQNDNNRAITYLRYSSHAQNDASIEQQREAAERYAEGKGFQIVKEYADAAMSGTTDARPQYQLLLSEIDKLKPAALILWKTDRLGRDRYELVLAKNKIKNAGCKIYYVAEENLGDSSESVIMESIGEAMAEFYSLNLSANIQRGMYYNAERCLHTGHNTFGYMKGEDKKYIVDPHTAPIVQRIFEDYAAGKSMTAIASELNQQGVKTSRNNKFTNGSIRKILGNDSYIGVYRYGTVVIEGGKPALVTKELYEKIQARLVLNKRTGSQRANGLDEDGVPRYWLTGKLFCGNCGHTMQGTSGTGKTKAVHRYYGCSQKLKHKKCNKKNVKKSEIETLVVKILSDILSDSQNVASLAVDAAAYYKRYHSDMGYLEGLEAEKKNVEKTLSNIMKAIEQGIFSDTTQARLMELEAQKVALGEAIETEQIKKQLMSDGNSIQSFFDKYLHEDFSNPETRDMILEYFIDKIYVYDDRLVFTGNYSDDKYEITWDELNKMEQADEFGRSALCSTTTKKA